MPEIMIEHRIGIQAPADLIWEVLKEPETWPAWNPLYPSVKGRLSFGAQLALKVALPGQPVRDATATIMEWVPDRQIIWSTTSMGGWVKTVRHIDIDALTDTGCIVANGEGLDGFLAHRAGRKYGRAMYNGFEAMNEALKARAEALWHERRTAALQ